MPIGKGKLSSGTANPVILLNVFIKKSVYLKKHNKERFIIADDATKIFALFILPDDLALSINIPCI